MVWLAGFWDADGAITIHKQYGGRWIQPSLQLTNTHRASIEHAIAILAEQGLEARFFIDERRPPQQTVYRALVTGMERIVQVARSLGPLSFTKRDQWTLIEEYCLSRLAHKGRNRPYTAREREIVEELANLHSRKGRRGPRLKAVA